MHSSDDLMLKWLFSKLIYKFKAISVKIPVALLVDVDKLILKFTWKFKEPQKPKQFWIRTMLKNSHLLIPKLLQTYSNQDSSSGTQTDK